MERISVTARLNRSTLQFEDAAFQRLQAYLAEARGTLAGNPDQDEIVADLEQAVADQCTRRLPPGQLVVSWPYCSRRSTRSGRCRCRVPHPPRPAARMRSQVAKRRGRCSRSAKVP